MITRSQNFNGCGNKIFLDCESDAYQSVKRQNDYRITKLDYNEATGILSISQNPDVTKFTNIGDNSVTSNTFRSHLDAIEYILDYNKFKKSGTSKFDKCSNYLVYNQYADADKKYIYFTYSENANRWYEISLNEGDEFYDKLKNIKYRYHNGRLVNIVDVKLTKSQDRVGDRGTNITLNVEPSTSKGVVIPVVDEYNAGLMHPNDYRRFKDIDSELVGSFNIVDVDKNHWKLELVNKNGEVIASILIDKDNDNYLHDVEATITNGRRTLNFQMYDKTGPTTIYNVDLEDWFDYTGLETSSIKVEVNDSDEISANLKISSDKDNTLSLDNEGLVSILKWLDGDRINFKLGTEVDYDSKVFENVIYFATDTKNIIINGNKYGIDFNDNNIDLVSKIEFTDTIGEFKITNTNGEIYTLSLPLATEEYNGLMSAADKKKLNTLANTSISQISKVFRDGQQGLEIVFSDVAANQTRTIFIPFSEVDRENNGLMSIADKIKLDNVDIIVNEINPFELEDEQFGTRLVYTVRDYRDPSNPVDITKYQELPLVQDTSSGLMPKEYKIKSDRILMYLQSVNTELTKTADTNTITFIEYNPNNNQSREVLVTFDEVTETEAGLLGAIDKVKLNRIVDYLISIEPETTKTSNTQVININRYNPNTNETVIDNVTITEATNEHAGLMTPALYDKLIKVDIDGMVNTIDRIFIENVEQKPDSLKDVYLDTYSTSTIDDKFQNLSDSTDEAIENLDKELNDRINSEVETINTRITTEVNNINSTITELENKHDQDVADINSSITNLTNKHNQDVTTINNTIDELETKHDNDVTSINQSIEDLTTKHDEDIAEVNQNISDLEAKHDAFVATKNQPGGFPSLDESGLVPANQLPSYVDDVIEVYATYDKDEVGDLSNIQLYADPEHQTPIVGESGKIYVNITPDESNYNFRWSGTQFSPIDTGGLILGEITGTAYDGGKGKATTDTVNSLPSNIVSNIGYDTTSTSIILTKYDYVKQGDNNYTPNQSPADITIESSTTSRAGVMTINDRKLVNQLNKIGAVSYINNEDVFTSTADNVALNFDSVDTAAGVTDDVASHSINIPAASLTSAGTMSAADKTKLDGLETIINNNLYYQSDLSDDLATLEEHGGLPTGTTVADLKQMTLSEIFDEILFPTIYPTYVNPSASLKLTSTSTTPTIQEVGTTGSSVPTISSFTTGYNPGAINILSTKQANRGGALDKERSFIYINGSASNTTFPTTIPDGNITYRYRAYYAQGPQPKDSKGNDYGTPLAAGHVDSSTVTVYGVYPYFTNKANITTFAKLPLTTSTTLSGQVFVAEGPNKHAFKLPAKYKLTKVEMLNTLSGKYENFGTDRWTVTTENINVQGHDIQYNVYTRNDSGFNGTCTFNITFSKS